ncbi:methionine-S-sulfoxide reductase [Anaeroplasma bactoclasticum]|jgi:methionine-S-sulfoxide reductase|uniref:Peptide methionine sulfoxide reductase MsrA n=1 Tax=Anaeroplasma bactoclasticum TaxID=2088 RepID=A0A397RVL0_9MOLU|nr:peptide-methionine (S)-S-oxide reductase MsrA [Anaeroplasma bactoclasticum]RIA78380.1 methionine-S-sulfoxide reductase [Anaeroplasma bactoclasticum]
MVEIYTSGASFTDIVKEASVIKGFNRESYAIRYIEKDKSLYVIAPYGGMMNFSGDLELLENAIKAVWDFNLKLGGVHGTLEVCKSVSDIFINLFGGKASFVSSDDTGSIYSFEEGKLKRALFAGGCFWCIAGPFYDQDGVLRVLSGYAGGSEINPTYKEVKAQLTHHRESILIEYDSTKTDYTRMVDIYFENIDPFDDGGQYIDRGDSYSPAVFNSDKEEKKAVIEYKYHLSLECGMECKVPILDNTPFFTAEEEHQNYAIKNPKEYEEELIASGRKKV